MNTNNSWPPPIDGMSLQEVVAQRIVAYDYMQALNRKFSEMNGPKKQPYIPSDDDDVEEYNPKYDWRDDTQMRGFGNSPGY